MIPLTTSTGFSYKRAIRGIIVIYNFFKKIWAAADKRDDGLTLTGNVYPRSQHNISRSQISENALKVLSRLDNAGFQAYLVGGCVRDLLLGREPKDFDVVTDASPEQVKSIFRNCRLIGRRFRLAHVFFGREIIEVATFRAAEAHPNDENSRIKKNGLLVRDNVFGTIEEDVWRRDFTVNSLYYNIRDFSVVDYTGGMQDHKAGLIKLIGDPSTRYREDPVRMLRAVRFAVKLGFRIEEETAKPINDQAALLSDIPAARLFDETVKLFLTGCGWQTFEMLRHYQLFGRLFPATEACLALPNNESGRLFVVKALKNSDQRTADGKSVTPYFLLAVFLWQPLLNEVRKIMAEGENETIAYQNAANLALKQQLAITSIPKRITQSMREVWMLQPRLKIRRGVRPFRLLAHPRFRAAYDFLLLRAEVGEAEAELADWWTRFQNADESQQKKMTRSDRNKTSKRRRNHAVAGRSEKTSD